MSDEEEDYMSDAFLLDAGSKNDVRPGLIYCRTSKRSHEMLKKKDKIEEEKKQKLSTKDLAEEKLKDGLENPICSSNKGFSLLQKMGFNPGTGLGKSGEGRLEPVPIQLKKGRGGLGRETIVQEVTEMMKTMKKKKMESCSTENFRAWRREQFSEKQNSRDLAKSQRICNELDTKIGISNPEVIWFWPEIQTKPDEDSDEGDNNTSDKESEEESSSEEIELSVSEKLQLLTIYLRGTHFHCIWCGTQYDDEKDMQSDCPGQTREDHE